MHISNHLLPWGLLAGLMAGSPAAAVSVTLTWGSPTSVTNLVLKPGETCELKQARGYGRYTWAGEDEIHPNGTVVFLVLKDGLIGQEWFPANESSTRFVISGPAQLNLVRHLVAQPNSQVSTACYVTFEVTPAPVGAEKLVLAPEGQSTRLVLEASTNLTQWAPVFSTVLTNVPANQFVRVRAEKLP